MQRLVAGLWILLVCGPALAGDAHEWLRRMHQAMETLSYRGTLVYAHGERLDVVRVVHRHDGHNLRERLYTLTGSRREVLRENGEVRCLFPEDQSLVGESQLAQGIFPEFTAEHWLKSRAYYDYHLAGSDRVAGLAAQVIDIMPKAQDRYGYRLWIDRDSGLLLRSMLRDQRKRAMEQISFTEIEITDDISDEELRSSGGDEAKYLTLPGNVGKLSQPVTSEPEWSPLKLPPGFALVAHNHIAAGDEAALEHTVYSDGLASVSIYVEQVADDHPGIPAQATRGSINVFSRRDGTFLITAVGELPYSTLADIGRSVSRGAAIAASTAH